MPLDKSLLGNSNDAWSEPDAFSAPFDKVASQRDVGEQRAAMGRTLQEPIEHGDELFVDNSALERPAPAPAVEPWPAPAERPRPRHEGVRHLLSGKPKREVVAAPAPPAPRPKPRCSVAAINEVTEKKAQRQALAEADKVINPPAPAPPPAVIKAPTPQPPIHPAESEQQAAFCDALQTLVNFSRAPRTKVERTAYKIYREDAYRELLHLGRNGVPGLRRMVSAWLEAQDLPQTEHPSMQTLDKAAAAAKRVLELLERR